MHRATALKTAGHDKTIARVASSLIWPTRRGLTRHLGLNIAIVTSHPSGPDRPPGVSLVSGPPIEDFSMVAGPMIALAGYQARASSEKTGPSHSAPNVDPTPSLSLFHLMY